MQFCDWLTSPIPLQEGSPVDRYDFGASPELLLKPSVCTNGIYGKKNSNRKTGVCEGEAAVSKTVTSLGMEGSEFESNEINEDDDDEDDEDDLSYYNPVILIRDKSLLSVLKHPKKWKTQRWLWPWGWYINRQLMSHPLPSFFIYTHTHTHRLLRDFISYSWYSLK